MIAASHLRAAHGQVKCGRCALVFDAIPHLIDDGLVSAREPEAVAAGDAPQAALHDASAANDDAPEVGAPEPGRALVVLADDGVPEVLQGDIDGTGREGSGWRGVAWFGLAVVLLVTLALQHAHFEPLDLVKRYPQALASVERWCSLTGCSLTGRREPERIRVITRDVRVHPRYEGALQVTATVVNTAPYPQPFPRVRFSVFNVNGETIASRTFESHEYLGAAPRPGAELTSRAPLQIALEMLAPEEAAISFEFEFL